MSEVSSPPRSLWGRGRERGAPAVHAALSGRRPPLSARQFARGGAGGGAPAGGGGRWGRRGGVGLLPAAPPTPGGGGGGGGGGGAPAVHAALSGRRPPLSARQFARGGAGGGAPAERRLHSIAILDRT